MDEEYILDVIEPADFKFDDVKKQYDDFGFFFLSTNKDFVNRVGTIISLMLQESMGVALTELCKNILPVVDKNGDLIVNLKCFMSIVLVSGVFLTNSLSLLPIDKSGGFIGRAYILYVGTKEYSNDEIGALVHKKVDTLSYIENILDDEVCITGQSLAIIYSDKDYMYIETATYPLDNTRFILSKRFTFSNGKLPDAIDKLIPSEIKKLVCRENIIIFESSVNILLPTMKCRPTKVNISEKQSYYNIVDPEIIEDVNFDSSMISSEIKIVEVKSNCFLVTTPNSPCAMCPKLRDE